ncbi:MAG: GTPase domain-containing protein [Saprospiraceae bacterium]
MKRNTKIFLLSCLIVLLGVISFILYNLFATNSDDPTVKTTALSGVLAFFTALLPFIFTEVRKAFFEKDDNGKNGKQLDLDDEDVFDIFIYGHSGSGKTTLIQRLFTYNAEQLQSTQTFDYYETSISPNLNSLQSRKEQIKVRIADYKGQDVNQVLGAAKRNLKINALLLVADIAPSHDEHGNKLSDDEVYHMMKNNRDQTVRDRLRKHDKYLSEFLLQVVFKYIYSTHLRSVRLIINKVDILERLQYEGLIPKETNVEEIAKCYFAEIQGHIKKFCESNGIIDFEVVTISAMQHQNITQMFGKILDKFIKSNKIFQI